MHSFPKTRRHCVSLSLPLGLAMDNASTRLDGLSLAPHSVAVAELERQSTPLAFPLLKVREKNVSACCILVRMALNGSPGASQSPCLTLPSPSLLEGGRNHQACGAWVITGGSSLSTLPKDKEPP